MQPDLTTCDTEPIHIPGAIQPFGVLLAFDANTMTLRHVSANSREVFGGDATSLLGASAADLLGAAAASALRAAVTRDAQFDQLHLPSPLQGKVQQQWHAVAHGQIGTAYVELEPADESALTTVDLLASICVSVERLAKATNIAEFCATTARKFRAMTGFDRVMVYRFDGEWNGEVVAEERRADQEPYLGLHYPASDIPVQARALFLINRVRIIPDAEAAPVPVLPDCGSRTSAPLDLSRCLLRSASPIHREYLHNMGVRASLTASLIVAGKLWGLVACHHMTPRRPGPATRETCELLAQIASAHLGILAEAEDRQYLAALASALARTGTRVGTASPPIAALAKDEADLLALVGAGGVVVWRSGRGVSIGQTPPPETIPGLIAWIKQASSSLIATDRLSQAYAPAQHFAEVASGLLALEVSRAADEYVLWFRPEVLQSVSWGGDPRGKAGPDGRISPRQSFAVWKETVRNRSMPWRPAEVDNAKKVKELLLAAASLSAFRLEGMLPICAWCKKVRDEPGYWHAVEEFIHDLVDIRLTHGVCPECFAKQMAELEAHKATHPPSF